MKKVLITGGAGFIGSHLCEEYLAAGYQVAVVDDCSTGKKKQLPSGVTFYKVSINQPAKLAAVFAAVKPHIVSHHAAQTKVQVASTQPELDAQINIMGLLHVLNLAKEHKVSHFIFASSGGTVYGSTAKLPTKESVQPGPESPYGLSKLAGEWYVDWYAQKYGFKATIFRYANVYGPRQLDTAEGGVVAIFINSLLNRQKTTIYGDGQQTRDFVYVKDIAKVNVLVSQKNLTGVFNVGTARQTSVLELYQQVVGMLGSTVKPQFKKARQNEVRQSALSAQKLTKALGKYRFTPFKVGLQETVTWFKNKAIQ